MKTSYLQKCPHKDILSCPYKKRKECPTIRHDCHLPEEAEQEPQPSHNNYILWIIGIGSLALILFSILEPNIPGIEKNDNHTLWNIVQALNISALAGVILTWLVNIPAQLRDYAKLISSALTSYEYLYGLERPLLSVLRNKVTHALHTKNVPNMPRGLIHLDQKICELLEAPYYASYRETIQCHRKGLFSDLTLCPEIPCENNLDLFLSKDVSLEYTIRNPYDKTHPIKADIGINNQLFLPNGCDIKGIFKIDIFQIAIDDKPFIDITPYIKITYNVRNQNDTIDPDEISYNTGLYLKTKDNKCLSREIYKKTPGIQDIPYDDIKVPNELQRPHVDVLFDECVSVKIKYRQLLPNADKHFTKRLRYSTESYRIDYYCDEEETQLFGQLFGLLVDQKFISISLSDDKRKLSMESFNWLLPGSGAFIVMGDKLKVPPSKITVNNQM